MKGLSLGIGATLIIMLSTSQQHIQFIGCLFVSILFVSLYVQLRVQIFAGKRWFTFQSGHRWIHRKELASQFLLQATTPPAFTVFLLAIL